MLTTPLKNYSILVTRPSTNGMELGKQLQRLGATSIHLPAITITPNNSQQLKTGSLKLAKAEIIIFLSQHAVEPLMPHWPKNLSANVLAIGPATQQKLQEHGITSMIPTEDFSSEGLLALPEVQNVRHKNIVVCCGKNPKERLFETLKLRSANIQSIYCYQRDNALKNTRQILTTLKGTEPDWVICTSLDALTHLAKFCQQYQPEILHCKLLTGSNSLSKQAKNIGWQGRVFATENPTNKALTNWLTSWYTL